MRRLLAMAAAVAVVAAACGGDGDSESSGGEALTGLFGVAAGQCGPQGVTSGSYFRMVQPGGAVADGPFVINGDSACPDKTVTPLLPGSDGGLRAGAFQQEAAPPFDSAGNGMSNKITQPQKWFAVAFALATNERDPQTKSAVPAPRVLVSGSTLTGDLSAFAASWNGQFFNQGAPKPGGGRPGNTSGPRGTYDPETRAYRLDWSSQIVGGPFNNFTGVWHLEGTFQPS